MSDQPLTLCEHDFEAIEAAVMETSRGRWFLAEYARRNRSADTIDVLSAITELGKTLSARTPAPQENLYGTHLNDMSGAIEKLYADLSDLQKNGAPVSITNDAKSLSALVQISDNTAGRISAAIADIQEVSWTMREIGIDPEFCDKLDHGTSEISTLCGVDDVSTTRVSKLVGTINYVQQRLNDMAADLRMPASEKPALISNESLDELFVDDVAVMVPTIYAAQAKHNVHKNEEKPAFQSSASSLPQMKQALSKEWAEIATPKDVIDPEPDYALSANNVTSLDFSSFSFEEKLALFS